MTPADREAALATWHEHDQPILRNLLRVADQGILVDAAVIDEFDYDYQQLKRIADHQELFGESATASPITPKSASSVESAISANGDGPRYRYVQARRRSVRRNIQAPRGEFTFRVGRQLFEDMRVDGAELEPGDIGNRKRKVRGVEKAIKRQRSTVAAPVRRRKGTINSFRNYDTLRS
jgi:hypothetical protein